MKKLLLITTPLILVACTQVQPPVPTTAPKQTEPSHASLPRETARQGQYIALPGQAAVDTDAAFDQQVAAYANAGVATAAPVTVPVASEQGVVTHPLPTQGAPVVLAPQTTTIPTAAGTAVVLNPVAPVVQQPYAVQQPMQPAYSGMQQAYNDAVGAVAGGTAALATGAQAMGMPQQPMDNFSPNAAIDYTLRITNGTTGRVYIEAQDAAGEIYPCGFMTGGQSISTPKTQVAPIKGPITVVVRDPDKPDAPEIRRYKVDAPTGYAGKVVEIMIIPGGKYQVSVDGQVRYITPTPVGKPDLGTAASTSPAEAAAKAAAENSAGAPIPPPAAPAPEANPAGI